MDAFLTSRKETVRRTMKRRRQTIAVLMASAMVLGSLTACGTSSTSTSSSSSSSDTAGTAPAANTAVTDSATKTSIEKELNLANNTNQEWSYSSDAKAWTLSSVTAVANPEIKNEQGVSVCVPGAYVTGIDTNGDGKADTTASNYSKAVKGSLVIDYKAKVTSTNGQVYTASTAPVILNTGAAGYSSSTNSAAATTYASDGYINVACGNRGKQDTAKDSSGNSYYTGDAPSCLVDQKDAARYVKYNILLGNLPGSVNYFVSTGGSGGGAHATMFAATSNNSDYYDYEIEAGAVGVYRTSSGYSTTVTINGKNYDLSDGAWGCIAYSAITPLYEADTAMAFEYYMDTDYDFNTSFQKQMAKYLSKTYMSYINGKNLSVKESAVGFDLNKDGDKKDTVKLTIQYDKSKHASTNGYYGTYLNLYLDEFTQNLQWYLDNLKYADDWTWFDSNGKALSDKKVAAMSAKDKAKAFLEGRYAKSTSSSSSGGPGGAAPGGTSGGGTPPSGTAPTGNAPSSSTSSTSSSTSSKSSTSSSSTQQKVGTPSQGTTQATNSSVDSSNYDSYADLVSAYTKDISSVYAGDKYGKNIVSLYNPLNYIGAKGTDAPTWTRIVMGASEGDMSMMNSLNMEIAWLNSGTDAEIEWQWDGGHVPSEVLGNSFSLYVDQMYGKYVKGAKTIKKAAATKQTKNGTATKETGTDISSWVNSDNIKKVSFSLAKATAYRVAGASKAIPGFDVMDYGQEDYVFGNSTQDARHWDKFVLSVLKKYEATLKPLFNKDAS